MAEAASSLTLFELNNRVRCGMRDLFPDVFWVVGEISELNVNASGHCYLELIEKKADSDQIVARAKATIWAFTFRMLRPYFESVTGQRFNRGIKIMVQVNVEFHEAYGYSLNVKDIEPNFTLGDLSRKKREIIDRLTEEGVIHLNKELDLPIVPQRIAVISSETAAGYGDFVDQLTKNRCGYSFSIKLFQAYMQGNEAGQSIIEALERIFLEIDNFDVVAIIRGGGSQADLDCFNSYWLCYHITQFPIPVITGIGHERDETIADMVAHTNLKTPTAVAEFIIDTVNTFETLLDELNQRVIESTLEKVQDWREETERLSKTITAMVSLRLNAEKQYLHTFDAVGNKLAKNYLQKMSRQLTVAEDKLRTGTNHYFRNNHMRIGMVQKNALLILKSSLQKEKNKLEQFDTTNNLLDPVHIMKRGYTLTFSQGMLIKSPSQLKPGDIIESKWTDGSAFSTIHDNPSKPEE